MITSMGPPMNLDRNLKPTHSLIHDPVSLTPIEHNHQVFLRTRLSSQPMDSRPTLDSTRHPLMLPLSTSNSLGLYSINETTPPLFGTYYGVHSRSILPPPGLVEGVSANTNDRNAIRPPRSFIESSCPSYPSPSSTLQTGMSPSSCNNMHTGMSNNMHSGMGYVSSMRSSNRAPESDLLSNNRPSSESPDSDVCRYWGKGTCRYNEACRFKHIGTAGRPPSKQSKKPSLNTSDIKSNKSNSASNALSHQDAQLRSMPALTSARLDLPASPSTDKSKADIGVGLATCRYWLQGICNRGNACRFVHAVTPNTHEYLKGDTKEEQALLSHVYRLQKLAGMIPSPKRPSTESVHSSSVSAMVDISDMLHQMQIQPESRLVSSPRPFQETRSSPPLYAPSPSNTPAHYPSSASSVAVAAESYPLSHSLLHHRDGFNIDRSYSPWKPTPFSMDLGWDALLCQK